MLTKNSVDFYNYPYVFEESEIKIALDKRSDMCYNQTNFAERSRGMAPKGITVRKVRASQGRITDNVSRRRLPGKCNRNKPPQWVRMERRGKSSPTPTVT